jgi:hypothetical protein
LTTAVEGSPRPIIERSGSLGSNVRFGHLLNFQHAHNSLLTDTDKPVIDTTLAVKITVADNDDINTPLIPRQLQVGYPHLTLNTTSPVTPNTYEVTRAEFVSLDLGNVLNFLNVPSRFVGTRDWYYDADGNAHYYSRFRDPGKININTMNQAAFWALLENRNFQLGITNTDTDPDNDDLYKDFDQRRGNYYALVLDPVSGYYKWVLKDVRFEAPYRSSASSWLFNDFPTYATSVNTTLLRNDPNVPKSQPLFAQDISDTTAVPNSYMALEGIQRLSDMTTTRSNVFAVWITLGYFEVKKIKPNDPNNRYLNPEALSADRIPIPTDANRFNAIYPDGYMLGKEVGIDTGEVQRHRAFYIIDRTVPFGYRRGKKLNSDNAVLLKRMIE